MVTDPVPHHMELDLATQDNGIAAPSKCLPHETTLSCHLKFLAI